MYHADVYRHALLNAGQGVDTGEMRIRLKLLDQLETKRKAKSLSFEDARYDVLKKAMKIRWVIIEEIIVDAEDALLKPQHVEAHDEEPEPALVHDPELNHA